MELSPARTTEAEWPEARARGHRDARGWVQLVPLVAAAIVGSLAASLLAGWLFYPGPKEFFGLLMKVNAALGMLLASISLAMLTQSAPEKRRRWGRWFAGAVLAIGAITVIEYLTDADLGIDQLVAGDFLNEESRRYPGRMSPIAATCFCFLALGLLFLDAPSSKLRAHLTSVLTVPVVLVSLVALTGYLYDVSNFYQLGSYIRIAWPTAGCFLLLGTSTLLARPDRGPVRFFANSRLSGMAARRLLPAVVVLPLAFGGLCLAGQQAGFFGLELGLALFAVSLVVVLGAIVWVDARALDTADREREKSEAKLAKALRLREEFLGVASHELKTPLTALLMQVQGVERAMRADPSLERYNMRLARASASALRLEKLINELLDVSRMGEGRLRLEAERFELGALVEEVAARFGEIADPQQSTIVVRIETRVVGKWDRLRIDQVLTNLLGNALKYGSGAPIEVAVGKEGTSASVTVRDHGIGIAKSDQLRIFERFERSVDPRSYSGFGLGLWIAREIVVQSGGTIGVESAEGAGACFTVRLPAED